MRYKGYDLPDELRYNKDSSWVRLEGGEATVGVIEPVAKTVKEFLFAKLPEKGRIEKGDTYVSLEALKWSGHLTSPLSGEVTAVNEQLFDEPSTINEAPYDAWIMKLKLEDEQEAEELHEPEEITGWLDKTLK